MLPQANAMPVINAILVECNTFRLFTFAPHLVGVHSEELLKLLRGFG
jgi:hypothetical protein